MYIRSRDQRATSRGQAMVEFAIILPILALLLVMALDFGRIFFGWIGLQNGARVAADFAARNADWGSDDQLLYRNLVINDMQGINCAPPPAMDANGNGLWDPADVPDPVFEDVDGNSQVTDDGDHATVLLSCRFDVITPLASSIVGSPVALDAKTSFPINQTLVPAIPTPEPTPPGPCPAPTALFSLQEQPPSGPAGNGTDGRGNDPLTIQFTDTSTDDPDCDIDTWEWQFGSGTNVGSPATFSGESPPPVVFDPPGTGGHVNYLVTLTVTSTEEGETDDVTKTIRVDR